MSDFKVSLDNQPAAVLLGHGKILLSVAFANMYVLLTGLERVICKYWFQTGSCTSAIGKTTKIAKLEIKNGKYIVFTD